MKAVLNKEFILEALENHMAEILNEIREDVRAGSEKEQNELLQFTQQLEKDTDALDAAIAEQFKEVDQQAKTIAINGSGLKPKLDKEMEKILEKICVKEIETKGGFTEFKLEDPASLMQERTVKDGWAKLAQETICLKTTEEQAKKFRGERLMQDIPTKWQPSGGNWFVHANGEVRQMSPDSCPLWWKNDMDEALESGRLYETEQQAVIAGRTQRAFMRFVRWCFEQDPGFEIMGLYDFSNLLINQDLSKKALGVKFHE